jgi:tRNA (guanine-N7-)-methyltransferase
MPDRSDRPAHAGITRTFKPRRRQLSARRAAALDGGMPRWSLAEEGPPLDLTGDVVLDIGIGVGDGLVPLAIAEPRVDVIGCDVHTPGIAAVLAAIEEHGLANVRVVHGDAIGFLDRLVPGSLAGVRIWFPDPWPKARQRHRRLVRPDVVERLVERLRDGGWLHLATDIDEYAAQMRRVCDDHPALEGGVIDRPAWRPVTRYEQRGLDAGRAVTDLWYTSSLSPPSGG